MEELRELLEEGKTVRLSCYKDDGYMGGYLSGEAYSEWLTKCKLFINSHCSDESVKNEALDIINNAHSNSLIKYDNLMGILKALESKPQYIVYENHNKNKIKKIFISHCSKDKYIVNKFVDLIKSIGVKNEQIYYSSYEETGAEYLEDCFDRIEQEFKENELLVIFMISRDFYKSEVCMAETGATWVLCEKNYIPVILPPYEYNNIRGVVRSTQNSLLLDSPEISVKLEKLKENIEKFLKIEDKVSNTEWVRKKEEFIGYIEEQVKKIEDLQYEIKDIKIVDSKIVCKIFLKNNTYERQRLESSNICIMSKKGDEETREINDWTITSVVVQPFEEVYFYISIDKTEKIKFNSEIDKKNSSIDIRFYSEN